MILPIRVYGDPVLREPGKEIAEDSEELQTLISNMIETMRGASGVGLAAPQVGYALRLFVVDLEVAYEQSTEEEQERLEQTFSKDQKVLVVINPEIVEEGGNNCDYEEGCLSIPGITETIRRREQVRVNYLDRSFKVQEVTLSGMLARVFEHEFDHLEGVLFVDRLSTLRRRLLKRPLREMSNGNVEAPYPLAHGADTRS